MGFDYFSFLSEEDKFDSIIVDEGQDFNDLWFSCLESMVKNDGELYVFADPDQNLFNTDSEHLNRYPVSKHRVTLNLRNSETINEWINPFLSVGTSRSKLQGGLPVAYFKWKTPEEEKILITREIGRLVSQGVRPGRITILSPHTREKSSLSGVEKINDWPLEDIFGNTPNAVKFTTIRSFKGLESDIVFLIGLQESRACTKSDIYVGGSRAKFLLYVFHKEGFELESLV